MYVYLIQFGYDEDEDDDDVSLNMANKFFLYGLLIHFILERLKMGLLLLLLLLLFVVLILFFHCARIGV